MSGHELAAIAVQDRVLKRDKYRDACIMQHGGKARSSSLCTARRPRPRVSALRWELDLRRKMDSTLALTELWDRAGMTFWSTQEVSGRADLRNWCLRYG